MADLELLLMRHGAGIKPGQDPGKEPPGPDGVLTAAGYRDAQAVGHSLAETLKLSFPQGCQVKVWYAPPPPELAIKTKRKGLPWPGQKPKPSISGEPKATALIMARYLVEAGIRIEEPAPWKAELPGPYLTLTGKSWCARTFSLMMAASLAVRMWGQGKAPLVVFRRGLGVRAGGLVVSLP